MEEVVELLFFDTFAHDNTEEINLDLVQFPKPVYVTEVRIIPLGARVQADFPGGVRLGATNPSQFKIEFFVNDLGKPSASTFESLGGFEYNQNGCINLECVPNELIRKIPTDGLVLRGWYTTITLAVYGTLTNNITEQIIQPVVNPTLPAQPNPMVASQQCITSTGMETEWPQTEPLPVPMEYMQTTPAPYQQPYSQGEPYSQEYGEYYNDVPKDPRSYHHTPEGGEWEGKTRPRTSDVEHERDRSYQKTGSLDREHSDRRERDREKHYRSQSRDRDRQYRDVEHEREWEHDDYHRDRDWDRDNRSRDRDRDRDRSYKHEEYRRGYTRGDERDERKRPRTPPVVSPKRTKTPHEDSVLTEVEIIKEEDVEQPKATESASPKETKEKDRVSPAEEAPQVDQEEFEPILSDEDILDDGEHYQDLDYDYTAYTNNDDLLKLFTPGVTEIKQIERQRDFKIDDHGITVEENLKTTIGIADDYFKSSITRYVLEEFAKLNTEIKEEFIHLCEKVITIVGPLKNFSNIITIYCQLRERDVGNWNDQDKEIAAQVNLLVESLLDWLKIALSYEMANIQDQPAYKIRHIKCGVRLVEFCCNCDQFIEIAWAHNLNVHQILIQLYDQEFMALSIKLMILKALDTYLLHRFAIEKFLYESTEVVANETKVNTKGYVILIKRMRGNVLVRLKFALNSLIKKMNLFEILKKLRLVAERIKCSDNVATKDVELLGQLLEQISRYCQSGPFVLSQPKRFLPVSAQFEISRCETKNVLSKYFEMFDLLRCFLLLLTHPNIWNSPAIKTPIYEILEELLSTDEGLEYFSSNTETINLLLKRLLQSEEEIQYSMQEAIDIRSHNLGTKMAYKIQAFYHLQRLEGLGARTKWDFVDANVIDELHHLFCLTFSSVGKSACAEILGLKDNLKCILQFFTSLSFKDKSENQINRIKRSPAFGYIADLLSFAIINISNVPMIETYAKDIFHIINHQDVFEEGVALKLGEIRSYISPFENVTSLSFDNISPFVEIIRKELDNVVQFPGPFITSLRVIHHLGISKTTDKIPVISENPLNNYMELKYKHVILQLYSNDGAALMTKILQKICDYYEQPQLYVSNFVATQGMHTINVLKSAVALLKQMLTYVIKCRNTQFNDLTAIPILLQTYTLAQSYSKNSPYYLGAQVVCADIVETLLVYTQPVSDEIHEKDSLNKTLWSQMSGEVIKYITLAPYTFISGLLIFSELLPLPLPVQSQTDLTPDEVAWVINLRKLWSAHLHPHSAVIQEFICRLCVTSQPQLLNLLRRVCVQLADLAAATALMITRGVFDAIHEVLTPKENVEVIPGNLTSARLLNFLACLATHSTLKSAVLHLLHKGEEKYSSLIHTFELILKINSTSTNHIQSQECILSFIQSLCDTEITLLQFSTGDLTEITSQVYLANALPAKEHLITFISMILEHLSTDNYFVTYLPAVRTLLLLTEHDYGFYHLREQLLKKVGLFSVLLEKLAKNFSKENAECLSLLSTLAEFLRVAVSTEEVEEQLPYSPRSIKLTSAEVKSLLGWNDDEDMENHSLSVLEKTVKTIVEEDNTFEALQESINTIIKIVKTSTLEISTKETYSESILPNPETLLVQFSGRTVFSSSDTCDERLTARFWLSAPNQDNESEQENITCDITEICRQDLSADFNLIREVEKLCRICLSDSPEDKGIRSDDDKMKNKKPYITPARTRGFPRAIPQRSDLFRSRPANTSRPPSLHVDDFVALETCGAQPTGPTGYNKISREFLANTRSARGVRGRAFITSERAVQYRQMSWWGAGIGRLPY